MPKICFSEIKKRNQNMNRLPRYRGLIKKIHISGQKQAFRDYNLTAIRNIPFNGVAIKMVTQVVSDFSPPHNWQLSINKTQL